MDFAVGNNGVIGIHDGVRPLVAKSTLLECYNTANEKGNAIPVVDIVETVRELNGDLSKTVDRNNYKLVQTPQCFQSSVIKEAYNTKYQSDFTDDASVAERSGITIHLVNGNRENIKITTPADLIIAEALIQQL